MRLCKNLTYLYGRDTRPAQVVNILLSGIWALMLWLHYKSYLLLDVPQGVTENLIDTFSFALVSTLFSSVGMVTKGKRHQVFKLFGLSLGAVFQCILANGYFSAYPPLNMMLVISLALTLWFGGALLYILKCEGLDGLYHRRY